MGILPFGLHPEGIQPFGLSPEGIIPFGLSSANKGNATSVTNSTSRTEVSANSSKGIRLSDQTVIGERYHMQVKNPDGTTVGDYVVVDTITGTHNGVRYGAVEDVDPNLVRKALLDFFALEPNIDVGR